MSNLVQIRWVAMSSKKTDSTFATAESEVGYGRRSEFQAVWCSQLTNFAPTFRNPSNYYQEEADGERFDS